MRRLEAQNNLFFITPQLSPADRIALSDKLIAKGFTSTEAIAAQTKGRFINKVKDLQILQRYKAQKPISDDSWQNVFAILLQVWKQRQYAQWRREEQNAGISLSPANFKIPPRNFHNRNSLADTVQNQWRISQSDRRTWLKTLKSRIEQQKNLVNGLQEIISKVEELTLG